MALVSALTVECPLCHNVGVRGGPHPGLKRPTLSQIWERVKKDVLNPTMTQWKRRTAQHREAGATLEETEGLRRDLARREEEIGFLRDRLAQALAGWREAQQRLLVMEEAAGRPDAGRD